MDATYSESPEIAELAVKLRTRYYEYIGHVDLDLIYFAEKVGTRPKKAKAVEIQGITNAWARQLLSQFGNTKLYCLSAWSDVWEELSPAQREWGIFKLLLAVTPDNDGKLRKPDINDFGILLEYFMSIGVGVNWEKAEPGLLPSLLDSPDPLPIPLPPDETDEGSTVEEE